MKKRTIIKLKSLFGGKSKLKRQLHQPPYTKGGSRTPSPPLTASPPPPPPAAPPSSPPPPAAPPRRPPSPPVPTSPVAPTAPSPPPGPRRLLPCATCARTFLPDSLPKHTTICEKTAAKKRKTFDSSRQRREGTDLAQFLPKNFGLPESSPFLEKSPPVTAKPQPKKTQTVRSAMCKPASELPKCPHCGRGFGARAFERHVEWCADKAKILPAAPAHPPAHVAQARHRLQARTQYKAPRAGRGSLTRDKSSNSRSASVESRGERALSPPPQPPHDSGDHHHNHARTRASESISSTECHEESPHVPVIRQSKRGPGGGGGGGAGGGAGGAAGDAARARQARLARDLNSNRIDDDYDPFLSAARQMKELMSSDTNIPKKIQSTPKDPSKTLPYLRNHKEKSPPIHLRPDNSKTIKDTLNKNTQRTPILQRMKSFGSSNSDYSSVNTFGGRSSSFRVNRNDKKASPKLNTTFTKSSKENVSTLDKSSFNRTSSLNKSFSNYSSNNSLGKSKDKPVSMSSSLHHSFQRTVKPPNRLEKIEKLPLKKDFVNLDSILVDDNSSTTDSNYIDPRLINENDNLPINVNTILNNPDIISSMESLLNTDNLPLKFESFKVQDNKYESNNNNNEHLNSSVDKSKTNESMIKSAANSLTPTVDDLSAQYDKIMTSLEQSIASKTSVRDDDSLCEDFDLEEFMTSFDEELDKQKSNKRSYSSTTRVVKTSDRFNSNGTSQLNSISSSPKVTTTRNGLIPFNKSTSMTFSNNNITETVYPSSVKRSASFLDSFQKKSTPQKIESQHHTSKPRNYKAEEVRLEQDIMLSLEEFEKFYENDKMEKWVTNKETHSYSRRKSNETETVKRNSRTKLEKKVKEQDKQLSHATNNHVTPNGKNSNDSAYSSLNRISPSKLSVCHPKEVSNMSVSLERAGSDSGASHRDNELRALSSDEFLALEKSTETLNMHLERQHYNMDKTDAGQRGTSHASSGHRTPSSRSWRSERRGELSASSTESLRAPHPLHPPPPPRASPSPSPAAAASARLSRFCHECGSRFPDAAKFCIECGVKRLAV